MADIAIEWVYRRAKADVAYHRHLIMVHGGAFLEKCPTLRQVLEVWWSHQHFVEVVGPDLRSLTIPMLPHSGKESESVHRKVVRMRLIISPLVCWGGGMSWVPTLDATEAHSY